MAVALWVVWVGAMLFGAFVGVWWGFARGYAHGWHHAKRTTMELFAGRASMGGVNEKTRR